MSKIKSLSKFLRTRRTNALAWLGLLAVMTAMPACSHAQSNIQSKEEQPSQADKSLVPPDASWYFAAGSPSEMLVHNGSAFIFNSWSRGDSVLEVDPSAPTGQKFRSSIPVMGYMFQGTAQGNYMYLANWFSLVVIDNTPRDQGHATVARQMLFHFPKGNLNTIASAPGRLYLGDNKSGLRILDITEPGSPILMAYLPEFEGIKAIAASPTRVVIRPIKGDAYIAVPNKTDTDGGAAGIDIKAKLALKGTPILIGQTLYDAAAKTIDIYDLQNAEAPKLIQTLNNQSLVAGPFNQQIFVAENQTTLRRLDITNPNKPTLVREFTITAPLPRGQFVLQDQSLFVLNQADALVEVYNFPNTPSDAKATVEPSHSFPLMRNGGSLEVVDEDPADAQRRGRPFIQKTFFNAYVQGDQITVIPTHHSPQSGHWTGRLVQQDTVKKSGFRHYSQQWAAALLRVDNYLLLGDGVVDISDVTNPKIIVPTTRPAANIIRDKNLAYLAQGDRMTILDLSTMPKPKTLGEFKHNNKKQVVVDVTTQGKTACVLSTFQGKSILQTLDVTDPANPKILAELELPLAIAMVQHDTQDASYLYIPGVKNHSIPSQGSALHVVDISTPQQPKLVATIADILRGDCYRIKIAGSHLYIADDAAGILVLDITNPTQPTLLNTLRGDDKRLQVYTDFIIQNNQLHALRYAQIDQWNLQSQPE